MLGDAHDVENLVHIFNFEVVIYGFSALLRYYCHLERHSRCPLFTGFCYVFLLHVLYRIILSSMGYKLGELPGIVRRYLYAGMPENDGKPGR